jgi:hypothetical protein
MILVEINRSLCALALLGASPGDGRVFLCLALFGKPSCTQFAPM